MKQLTDIVWPAIRESAKTELQQASETSSAKVAVLEAAVLLEAGWTDLVDEVWVLSVPREVAIQRLHERNGLSEEEALRRINAQMTNEERVRRAAVVISTDQPVEVTQRKIEEEFDRFLQRHTARLAK
eukprot:TRINITY_DN8637_c0_g1_i1.p1 TRINITY_DN8637_c0_g1~~TRINITY_DN8637_c0_g1_i1.p1  ORF type:complete len:128 (-),score=37.66 TRINITY_DN8637_c0_g1_i1:10-393(-)